MLACYNSFMVAMVQRTCRSVIALCFLICLVRCQEDRNISLTFVIDNTVSMASDIKNVLKCADGIFDTAFNSKKSGIVDFVIVTFNDPDYKLHIITDKREEFKSSLSKIKANGGGDCPEKSMSGIELGLKSSRPFSYVYVFTDARAKDMEKYEIVKNLALNLNAKINFIITEMKCEKNVNFTPYTELALKTGGDFFILKKKKIPEILSYVKRLIETKKVEILRRNFKPDEEKKVDVSLDPFMKDAIVSVTGGKTAIEVKDKLNATIPTEHIVDTRKAKIVAWKNTEPGSYHIYLDTDSKENTILVVRGTSTLSFIYGFTVLKSENMNGTTNRPVANQKSYILIKLKTEGENINLKSIQVLDLKDKVLLDKPMNVIGKEAILYISEPILFPDDTFKIKMIAEDEKTKENIERTSLPIEPQKVFPGSIKDEAPKVTIAGDPKVTPSYGSPLQLTCRVTGHPKPTILWTDDIGSTLKFEVLTLKVEYEFVSVLEIEKITKSNRYICKASNSINSDEKSVEVKIPDVVEISKDTIKDEAPKVTITGDPKVTPSYGSPLQLTCRVTGHPKPTILWTDDIGSTLKFKVLTLKEEYEFVSVLDIDKITKSNRYICKASNSINSDEKSVEVKLSIDVPKIDKKITEICVTKRSHANITCRILKGDPKPTIEWFFKAKNKDSFYPIKEYKEYVYIKKVTANLVGTYKCIATNEIDKDSHVVDLIMEYSPVLRDKKHDDILEQIGKTVKIPCKIDGEPTPSIHWSIEGKGIEDIEPYKIYRDHTLSFKASIETMGDYSCKGVNKLGSIEKTAKVSVFEPVSFDIPKDLTIKIKVGRTLAISCPVKGYPTPKIRWDFYSPNRTKQSIVSEKTELLISAIQANESGNYVCVAKNSDGKEKSLRYDINVEVPPSIKPEERNIIAINGDKVVRLPCISIGDPKPTIAWIYNGKPLATGHEYYDIESDGTLVIKNVQYSVAGTYACVAESNLGKFFAILKVTIETFPREVGLSSIKYLEVGQPAVVKCNVPHTSTDKVRWYKRRNLIKQRDLVFKKYEDRHNGLYKCRVSNDFKSITGSVRIKTGFKPRFAFPSYKDTFGFNEPDVCLNCGHSANPKAKITWWKNKVKLLSTAQTYCCKELVSSIGEYECHVENELGNIRRKFEVKAKNCLLDIKKDLDRYHPLVLNHDGNCSNFSIKDGHIVIPVGHIVQFFCHGSFNKFTDSLLKAECVGSQIFKINGEQVNYPKLKCIEALQPTTIETREDCANGLGEIFRIGISITEFFKLYDICYHKKLKIPLYAEYILNKIAAGVNCAVPEIWFNNDVINYNNVEMYDCKQQRNDLTTMLGRDLPGKEDECFGPKQLVSEKDLPAGFPQMLAHSYLNIIPQWNSDSMKYWDILEENLRTVVKGRHTGYGRSKIFIRTGIFQSFQLPVGKSGVLSDVYIKDKAGHKKILPVILWKVITDELNAATVAIIQVIIPGFLGGKMESKISEVNKCSEIKWLEGIDADYLKSGNMVCCSIDDFQRLFGQRVAFSIGYRNLLKILSISEIRV